MKKIHHSTGDWLYKIFNTGADYTAWQLYIADFVSPPSSLNMRPTIDIGDVYATPKHAQCQNMLEGRIISWISRGHLTRPHMRVLLGMTSYTTYSIAHEIGWNLLGWQKYRITWWFAYDDQNKPSTRVQVEHWVDPDWVVESTVDYDPFTGTTNMIGIGGNQGIAQYYQLWDNTEIWIPST